MIDNMGIPHNAEMLKLVRDTIAKEESEVCMGVAFHGWPGEVDDDGRISKPNCNTPACIAGWTIHVKYKDGTLNTDHMTSQHWSPVDEAQEILGLTEKDANDLFYLVMEDDSGIALAFHWSLDNRVSINRRKEIVLRQLDAILAGEPIDWRTHWEDVDPFSFPVEALAS